MPYDHVVLATNYFISSRLLEETNGQGFDYNEWSQKNELRKFEFLPVLPLVMCLALKAQFGQDRAPVSLELDEHVNCLYVFNYS